jgi:hypothetical protein
MTTLALFDSAVNDLARAPTLGFGTLDITAAPQDPAVILVLLVAAAGLIAIIRAVVTAFAVAIRPAFALVRTLLLVLAFILLLSAGLLSRSTDHGAGSAVLPRKPAPAPRSGPAPRTPPPRTTAPVRAPSRGPVTSPPTPVRAR